MQQTYVINVVDQPSGEVLLSQQFRSKAIAEAAFAGLQQLIGATEPEGTSSGDGTVVSLYGPVDSVYPKVAEKSAP